MMAEFIANRILEAGEFDKETKKVNNLAGGQAKYRAYFVQLKIYARYQNDVDAILTVEGAGDCIVTA
jgi:hypothetical protein